MTSPASQTPATAPQARAFQVDLRGLVDLLSHHLYSSPQVYLRELLQNGVDAITARRQLQTDCPAELRITTGGGRLRVDDSGIGVTTDQVHELLATIGASSKRDDLESARAEFLGQFGIGLLACFLVASEIRVITRSATDPAATDRVGAVEWIGRDDGSYAIDVLSPDADVEHGRITAGTTVELTARPGMAEWFEPARVVELARHYGSLLPVDVQVVERLADDPATGAPATGDSATVGRGDSDGGNAAGGVVETAAPITITDHPAVWRRRYPSATGRRVALNVYCEQTLGFSPLDVIDLDLPVAGVRGVAFVLPHATSPALRPAHRVYLKGMLLTDRAEPVLPDWAFFVRCVLDTDSLRPTASRESLYEDDTLVAVREGLGDRIRAWLAQLATAEPGRLSQFLSVHHLGVKALAKHDDEFLRLMLPWLPFETTDGTVSLAEFLRAHPVAYVAPTVDEFRQVAQIARAQGIGVLNGGYSYDADLALAAPRLLDGVQVTELDPAVLLADLDHIEPATELALAGFLDVARRRLDSVGCDVVIRSFHPVDLPALYIDSRDGRYEQQRAEAQAAAETGADDLWSGILASLQQTAPRARLVLNHLNPLLRRIAGLTDPDLAGTAVESLYGQAILLAHRPLRPADSALLNRSFAGLLEQLVEGSGHGRERGRER